MLQKFKIAFYAIIVWLVLPSQAVAENPHLNGIPAAASCGGWDCSQNPNRQLCLKGTPGAKREHYICMHERDNKWIAAAGGTKTRADQALEWEKQTAELVADVFRIANYITTEHRRNWPSMDGNCPEAYSSGKYTDHLPPAQETKAAALCLCTLIDERLNKLLPPHPHAYKAELPNKALMEWGVEYIYEDHKDELGRRIIRDIKRPVPMYKSCVDLEQ